MAVNEWSFIYADKGWIPQGELLNASNRTVSIALSKVDTASFTVRTDHPMADKLLTLEGFLKVYRNGVLLFYGELISAEESVTGEGGTISVNAAAPPWKLAHRYPQMVLPEGSVAAGTDRAVAALNLINIMNTQYYSSPEYVFMGGSGVYATDIINHEDYKRTGHTFINGAVGPHVISAGSTLASAWTIPAFKPMSEIMTDLASGTTGFDWRFMPVENPVLPGPGQRGPIISNMWAEAGLGAVKPEAVFEFGGGKSNIKSYSRTMSRDHQANSVRHVLPNGREVEPVRANESDLWLDYSARTWGIMEDTVQAELVLTALRSELVAEHVAVRKLPRHTIVFEPTPDYGTGRLPRYGIDYTVGDTVTGRAVSLDTERFNANFRVWGIEFMLDDFGVETPKLTLSEEGA